MSAAQWRRAMNSGAGRYALARSAPAPAAPVGLAPSPRRIGPDIIEALRHVRFRHVIVLAGLLVDEDGIRT